MQWRPKNSDQNTKADIMANTKAIENKTERKEAKRAQRKKAEETKPLGERDYPRGSKKSMVKKLVRGTSKR